MVDNVTSLTGRGLRDWLVQRVTALIAGAYAVFLISYFLLFSPVDYDTWYNLIHSVGMRIFTLLALVSIVLHAWIGIWTVLTDYVKQMALRITIEVLVYIALVSLFFWGVIILWQ